MIISIVNLADSAMLSTNRCCLLGILLLASTSASAEDSKLIYKCTAQDQVIFSQQPCPSDYTQHQLEYHYGLATETATQNPADDPLLRLLAQKNLTEAQLRRWLETEIYRLQQEHSYLEMLRTGELQKLDRERYWEHIAASAPAFLQKQRKINQHYDDLQQSNQQQLTRLQEYKLQLAE